MKKIQVNVNFSIFSPKNLVSIGYKIAAGLLGETTIFANINPTAAELQTEAQKLENLLREEDALTSQLKTVQQKIKQEQEVLASSLKSIGLQVEIIANKKQNPAIVNSAGLELHAEKSSTTSLGVPNNLRLQEIAKTSSTLLVAFDSVPKARNYGLIWAYGSAPPVEWAKTAMLVITSSRGNKISFERGQTVWVRVKAYGPNNTESDWSDVATRIVP